MSQPAIYCVLGMHRSGTSILTRCLSLLGMELGPESRLLAPTKFNPLGFWEHKRIVALNDKLLARLGGSWRAPPALAPSWECDASLEDLREKAREIIAEDFADKTVWGFKDPRTCVTLPFWRSFLPPMRHVLCLRNPADVARSLEHAMTFEQGARLWTRYVAASLVGSADDERVFVHYEDLVARTDAELGRIARAFGFPTGNIAAAVGFVRADMRHHRTPAEETFADARLPLAAKALYRELTAATGPRGLLENLANSALKEERLLNSGHRGLVDGEVQGVCGIIHERDPLHRVDPARYFAWGQFAVRCVRQAMFAAGHNGFSRILDARCGYGTVARALRAAFPGAALTVCDRNREAADFCAETFHATPATDSADAAPFDLIWAGLLRDDWAAYLDTLVAQLAPGGIIVAATNGRRVAERLRAGQPALLARFDADGFASGESTVLLSLPFVVREIQARGLRVVHAAERGWFRYHDIIACARTEEAA